MTSETQGIWVYGIVSAGASLETLDSRAGDDLPEVSLVEAGDLAAIVSDRPADDPKATRNQALAHARVLEAAVQDASVVPFRFGIICSDDEEVSNELLQARHDEFAQLLETVEGRVQMVLKVTYEEEPLLREILDAEPEIAQLREATRGGDEAATQQDRVRLGELVNTAIEQRRERDSADILEHLKPAALSAVLEQPESELMVLNAPFLVERERQEEFEQAVEELAEERRERMHFRLLGPMPVYHFVDAGEPAWA